jgi:hypothetical protein
MADEVGCGDARAARRRFAALFRRLRVQAGLSYRDLERPTLATRGWISNVASGVRWLDRLWAERADAALFASSALIAAWDAGEDERRAKKRATALLALSVKTSEEILAVAAVDAADTDTLNDAVTSLGVAYLRSPPRPMLEKATAVRDEVIRRLRVGAVRPGELADLYLAAGRASGILAYAALDLGHVGAAGAHGQAAWRLADLAGSEELRAWVRGTQSLVQRFARNYDEAAALIADRMKHASTGTSTRAHCPGPR